MKSIRVDIPNHIEKTLYIIICASVFLLVLKANMLTPLVNEDFDLQLVSYDLGAIAKRCSGQYLAWNARIGDVLSLLLSLLPIGVFNFINSLSTVFFIFLMIYIGRITGVQKFSASNQLLATFFVFLSLIFFIQRPGEIFLWRTGSANYLYPAIFYLIFLIPYFFILFQNKDLFGYIHNVIKRNLLIALYSFSAIIVAHGNENVSPVVLALMVVTTVRYFLFHKKIKIWFLLSVVSFFLGVILLIFGPSTQRRMEFYSETFQTTSSPVDLFLTNFTKVSSQYFLNNLPAILIGIALLFSVVFFTKKETMREIIIPFFTFFVLSFLCSLVLATAPYQEPRAFFMSSVLLLIGNTFLIYQLKSKYCIYGGVFLVFLWGIMRFNIIKGEYENLKLRHLHQNQRILLIQEQINNKMKEDIVVNGMPIVSSRLVLVGGDQSEADRMSRYFKLDNQKIIVKNN